MLRSLDPAGLDTAVALIAASASVERALWLIGAAVLALLLVARVWRPRRDQERGPSTRAEARLVLVILGVAILLRTVGVSSVQAPRFYFSEQTVSVLGTEIDARGLAGTIERRLGATRVVSAQESPVLAAVHGTFDRLLGPSFELPAYVGAFWGTLSVALAWLVGRTLVSTPFGLAFAAFVAVSPLQVVWARLGGVPLPAVPHTLLMLLVAYWAGARGSLLGACGAGLVAFSSFYHYYAARVAIPLGGLAMLQGLRHEAAAGARRWLVVPVAAAVFALCLWGVAREGALATLWPHYRGYVGNRGEQTAGAFLGSARGAVERELPRALRAYFWMARTQDPLTTWQRPHRSGLTALDPGIQFGGLCLVPLALLGGLGLLVCLRHPLRSQLWLALAAAGILLPVLSRTTSRRFVIFDLAWCALAAHGLVWANAHLLPASRRLRHLVLGAGGLAVALWSAAAVLLLQQSLPLGPATQIPFGESGFLDGSTCLGCVAAARRWQREITDGDLVVLFDSDLEREDPGSPAGLRLYGRIAARAGGHPGRFLEFYSVLQNVDREADPPRVPRLFDPGKVDGLSYLAAHLRESEADTIIWEFRHPTRWEQALAARLVRAGGTRVDLDEPPLVNTRFSSELKVPKAFQVRTPRLALEEALHALAGFLGWDTGAEASVRLQKVGSRSIGNLALTVLGATPWGAPGNVGAWAVGSLRFSMLGPVRSAVWEPVAMMAEGPAIRVVDRFGREVEATRDGRPGANRAIPGGPKAVGRGCAAFAGGRWWIVDGLTGELTLSPRPATSALPRGAWFGVAAAGPTVVLASAEQELWVVDASSMEVRTRFPARVSPASTHRLADCSPIAAGTEWIATLSPFTARIAVYSTSGRPLADLRLARSTRIDLFGPTSIAGAGRFLGVTQAHQLDLFELVDGEGLPEGVPSAAARTAPAVAPAIGSGLAVPPYRAAAHDSS
jgi:hypothetical protein